MMIGDSFPQFAFLPFSPVFTARWGAPSTGWRSCVTNLEEVFEPLVMPQGVILTPSEDVEGGWMVRHRGRRRRLLAEVISRSFQWHGILGKRKPAAS